MRLLLYTGKGGVGKTTTAAATAACAAARGDRVLVVSADAAHSLGDVLGERLGPVPLEVAPGLKACEVDARHVIETHWGRVREYLVNLLRHQGIDEVVAEELALLPGADELATLVSVEDFAASGRYDLIVVDCAPTGSTLRLVTLPEVAHGGMRWLLRLQRAAARVAEPIARGWVGVPVPKADVFAEAEQLFFQTLGRLRDRLLSEDTSVRIVVTPESMVIDEARRALTDLALFELATDAVVLNRMLPAEALEEEFFRDWGRAQVERRAEVASAFAPLPILEAPLAEDEVRGVAALAEHGRLLFGERSPSARLGHGSGLRFERAESGGRLRIPLSGQGASGLDVARIEDDLVIGIAGRRRRIALPAGFARLDVERVAVEDAALVVAFGEPDGPVS
ncbi:MAG: TRC40/GET3/ArsA family transport-energizing ATPase [Myxococcota bacterium]